MNDAGPAEAPSIKPERTIRVLVGLVAFWALLIIPFKIVGLGFRPADDARRHVAKVLADKPWEEILVLRPEFRVDPHPGWHALLGAAHDLGIERATALLAFSVILAAGIFLLAPLPWLRAPEAWMAVLAWAALGDQIFLRRLLLGRPFLVSMAAVAVWSITWHRFRADKTPRAAALGLTLLVAFATWIHGGWYVWVLPVGALALAEEWRAARRTGVAALAGVLLGAAMTGAPISFLSQTLLHTFWAIGRAAPRWALVMEFQPSGGVLPLLATLLAFLAWRLAKGEPIAALRRDPVLLVAAAGWILGLQNQRFWYDWGMPAALIWIAAELTARLPEHYFGALRPRLLAGALIGAALFLLTTADLRRRWSMTSSETFLSTTNQDHSRWLPDPGGVLYSSSMSIFYRTFFHNPTAPWRYVLGFEPALMPNDDLEIYERTRREDNSDASLRPWAAKLRPEDRLVIIRANGLRPAIDELEWHSPLRTYWIGRLPRGDRKTAEAVSRESPESN